MKANGLVIAAMLLSVIQRCASFATGPLVLIDTVAVDPEGVAGAVDGCEFSKDGVYFAASDNHGVARIYLTADRSLVAKVTHKYHDHTGANKDYELNAVVWSHDGRYIEFIDVFKNKVIVGDDEGNVRMYEFSSAPSPKP